MESATLVELNLKPTPASARRARQAVKTAIADYKWVGKDLQATFELLVTELVTNAIVHGSPPIELRVALAGPRTVEVSVIDGSSNRPVQVRAVETDESGRGLMMVERLSDAWGVQPVTRGKRTWFRIDA